MHGVKRVRIRNYSGPHFSRIFPHSEWIRRDTAYLSVFSPNAGKCRKMRTRITPNTDSFYAVMLTKNITLSLLWPFFEFFFVISVCYRIELWACYWGVFFYSLFYVYSHSLQQLYFKKQYTNKDQRNGIFLHSRNYQ